VFERRVVWYRQPAPSERPARPASTTCIAATEVHALVIVASPEELSGVIAGPPVEIAGTEGPPRRGFPRSCHRHPVPPTPAPLRGRGRRVRGSPVRSGSPAPCLLHACCLVSLTLLPRNRGSSTIGELAVDHPPRVGGPTRTRSPRPFHPPRTPALYPARWVTALGRLALSPPACSRNLAIGSRCRWRLEDSGKAPGLLATQPWVGRAAAWNAFQSSRGPTARSSRALPSKKKNRQRLQEVADGPPHAGGGIWAL